MILDHNMTEMAADLETQRAARHGADSTAPTSILSLAFEQAERELGAGIGYPALVYDVEQTYDATYDPIRRYTGLYRGGCELSEQETAQELNRLRAQTQALRIDLATAHEAIGQAIALLNQGRAASAWSVLSGALRRGA